ncbi:M20/M25/M40 family metallo-hydrolase [Sporosarcina sp. ACRSL]|uniref:M20/M25/M40 family metallo-hydrolase n=1 Tax=Sporosarcina sp. ACRSL TaxID=2918215 RepID=UPI001EF3DFAA|nr:M20/M25/M40 family metallo-hydrolase [Sporosarcina sp. ACRSL]MCG7344058.1 M20/M25/M40 family metallo-hydrolase [Sporosarcina sp. ACRSL]
MESVYRYIEENQATYIEMLKEFCRQESVSTQNRGLKETAKMLQDYLQSINMKTEIIETTGHPIVYGESFQEGLKTLSFYNHYDVQPEDPIDLWESDPFGAEVRDGKLYARGSADNKGALMARICAIHAYQEIFKKLPVNVKFIVEGEEESGSPHIDEFIEKYPDKISADLCIWENGIVNNDGSFELKLGTKGMLYVELVARGANSDLHSSNGAIIENPAWRLIWALNTLKNENEEILIDGFYDKVFEPTDEEVKVIQELKFDEEETLSELGLDQFVANLKGINLKDKLFYKPTCTICGFNSGYTGEGTKTVLPSEARVKVDFRLVPDQDPEEIAMLLRKHLDSHGFNDIEIIIPESGSKAARTDLSLPVVKSVIRAMEKLHGIPPNIIPMSPGSGPMYKLCHQFGIPTMGFGVGNPYSNKHAPNENINLQDFIEGIKMVATVIHELGSMNNDTISKTKVIHQKQS